MLISHCASETTGIHTAEDELGGGRRGSVEKCCLAFFWYEKTHCFAVAAAASLQ